MKRFFSLFLSALLILSTFSVTVYADGSGQTNISSADEVERIVLNDGSYFEITIADFSAKATQNVKVGAKTCTHKSADGRVLWTATLTARFTYDGITATCTNAVMNVSISHSSWYLISKSTSKSGNKATGTVSMGYRVSGVTAQTITRTITLTCDKNGNLN